MTPVLTATARAGMKRFSPFYPMTLLSPAKINLFLQVTGKRMDGYHDLYTWMCCIDLHDRIGLTFATPSITVRCPYPGVPEDADNLAARAARRFFDAIDSHDGVGIDIQKQIPPGAGLGGGSSNAATVLMALNQHYGSPFSKTDLMRLGASVGADVPFFIFGKSALATGIGDCLAPCPALKPYPMVLIYPGMAVSTAQVYKNLNLRLTKKEKINIGQVFNLLDNGVKGFSLLFNDLEAPALALCPDIARAKAFLTRHQAMTALMTGSGSGVFGLFETLDAAENAYAAALKMAPWQAFHSRLATA